MKMKRFVAAAAALLIMVSMIGSGFSYWYFSNNTVSSSSVAGTKEVTQLIKVGTITAADTFALKFDQANRPSGSTLTKYTVGGIKAVFAESANTVATYTSPTDEKIVDKVGSQVTYDFIVTMSISASLAEYFNASMKTGVDGWDVKKADSAVDGKITITFTGNEKNSFDWKNVEFSYVSGKEPTNESDYNTFKGIVNNTSNTISVVYTVTLRDAT